MNAISWMIEKAQTETLEDGTVSHFFSGNIPASMKRQIVAAATANRGTNNATVYSADGATWGWSAVFGAHTRDQYSIRFTYNDYTVPASAQAS